MRKMDALDYPADVGNCITCKGVISDSHGGIGCSNCDSLYCCETRCIPQEFLKKDVSQSHNIDHCPRCVVSKADEMLKGSADNHFQTVLARLNGKKVDPLQLWLSVGYFLYGIGRHATIKPWRNERQLDQLKRDTHRTLPSSSG